MKTEIYPPGEEWQPLENLSPSLKPCDNKVEPILVIENDTISNNNEIGGSLEKNDDDKVDQYLKEKQELTSEYKTLECKLNVSKNTTLLRKGKMDVGFTLIKSCSIRVSNNENDYRVLELADSKKSLPPFSTYIRQKLSKLSKCTEAKKMQEKISVLKKEHDSFVDQIINKKKSIMQMRLINRKSNNNEISQENQTCGKNPTKKPSIHQVKSEISLLKLQIARITHEVWKIEKEYSYCCQYSEQLVEVSEKLKMVPVFWQKDTVLSHFFNWHEHQLSEANG